MLAWYAIFEGGIMSRSNKAVDMTQGTVWKHLAGFAAPMLIGLIFQQLYNTVDSLVVGNYVSKQALAAVGSVGMLINSILGFFSGLSVGAGVVIARAFGSHDRNALHKAVQTTLTMTFILCVAVTLLSFLLIRPMMSLLNMPDEMYAEALTYLRIYFAGVSGLMIYNMGSGILRAVGDSKRPLYFLIFSAIVNTVCDLIFVLVFRMGVAGVAWATVLSQAVSAILVLYVLIRSDEIYRFDVSDLMIDMRSLKLITRFGLPTAVQSSVVCFSNVFFQSYINQFGTECAAGWTIYGKLDQFAMLPLQGLSMANTTFVGQNLGAGMIDRAKKGVRSSIIMSLICTVTLMIPLFTFRRDLLSIFNSDPGVLQYGELFVTWITPFYLFICFTDTLGGALRGAGEANCTMIASLSCYVVIRQIYLYVMSKFTRDALIIGLGYPLGWVLCAITLVLCWKLIPWEKKQAALHADS